jgi:3-hydroxyacyl-CoA dehydrogenase
MFVFKAAVVGAGTMGGQIAQTIAAAGIPVVLKDVRQEFVDAGLTEARNVTQGQVARLVKKGRLTEEQAQAQVDEVVGRIHGTTTYDGFGDVDFVIEAVPERMEIKQAVFAELDAVTPGHAILASNTSSLAITEIGDATLRPDKVVGFHYFYPASVMPLVEVIDGDETAQETVTAAVNFAQAIKKQPITCGDVPGFVVNRILMSGMAEIWRAQEERGLSIKAIDEAISAQNVSPMGPFFLTDLLGLDTVLHVAEHLEASYGPERFYVHRGLQQLVADGKLGAKTGGEGGYKDGQPNLPGDAEVDAEELADLLTLKSFVEACLLLEEGAGCCRRSCAPTCSGSTSCWRSSRPPSNATASASRRRSCCAGSSPRGGWGRRPARASTPTRSRTPMTRPRPPRSSSSRRAATWRSPGWPTGR